MKRQCQIAISDDFIKLLDKSLTELLSSEWGIRKYYLPIEEYLPYCQKRRDIMPDTTVWRFSNEPFKKEKGDEEL